MDKFYITLLCIISISIFIVTDLIFSDDHHFNEKYQEVFLENNFKGLNDCKSHGQEHLVTFLDYNMTWVNLCYQNSPYKIIVRNLE